MPVGGKLATYTRRWGLSRKRFLGRFFGAGLMRLDLEAIAPPIRIEMVGTFRLTIGN